MYVGARHTNSTVEENSNEFEIILIKIIYEENPM
jgi:hypothetical protein